MGANGSQLAMEILGAVLSRSRVITLAEVEALAHQHVQEGVSLEYKRGQWLGDKSRDATREIRQHLSGFANADGGLLIIGIVDGDLSHSAADRWTVEGAECPGGPGMWDHWISSVLQEIMIRTRARWQVIEAGTPNRQIVLLAVDRSDTLIRVYEKPERLCYLRIQDQTLPMNHSHVADLELGRRAKPDLELGAASARFNSDSEDTLVVLDCEIRNKGLVWVSSLRVAWVAYSGRPAKNSRPVSDALLRHIEVRKASGTPDVDSHLRVGDLRCLSGDQPLAPFETAQFGAQIRPSPTRKDPEDWLWAGALVVIPRDGAPLWAQIGARGHGSSALAVKVLQLPVGTPPLAGWLYGTDAAFGATTFFEGRMVV